MGKPKFSLRPIHPGKALASELESRKMTPEQFSEKSRISLQCVKDFLNGKIFFGSMEIAKTAAIVGPSERFWTNMQRTYVANTVEK